MYLSSLQNLDQQQQPQLKKQKRQQQQQNTKKPRKFSEEQSLSECEICMEPYNQFERQPYELKQCTHILCHYCIESMFEYEYSKCPFCREVNGLEDKKLRKKHLQQIIKDNPKQKRTTQSNYFKDINKKKKLQQQQEAQAQFQDYQYHPDLFQPHFNPINTPNINLMTMNGISQLQIQQQQARQLEYYQRMRLRKQYFNKWCKWVGPIIVFLIILLVSSSFYLYNENHSLQQRNNNQESSENNEKSKAINNNNKNNNNFQSQGEQQQQNEKINLDKTDFINWNFMESNTDFWNSCSYNYFDICLQ